MLRLRWATPPVAFLMLVFLPLVGCGGNSPTSPSGGGKVVLHGVAVGTDGTATASAADVSARAASGNRITVTVQENTSISTTVSSNGTFELEGVPSGSFTLVFSSNTTVLGTITITGVPGQGEINIVVQVTVTTVVLIELEIDDHEGDDDEDSNKTCMIEGGKEGRKIELEGTVQSGTATNFILMVNGERSHGPVPVHVTASAAKFECKDKKGNKTSAACSSGSLAGAKVHVKGTLTECSLTAAEVVATEVKVQKAEDDEDDDDDD